MKKLFILTILVLICTILHAQGYYISFVGSEESTTVDSVEVENINTSEVLAFPGNQVLNLVGEGLVVSNLINKDNGDIKIFPNPISESSTIEFTLPKSSKTDVEIFDILGKEVASTTNILGAGRHSFIITGLCKGIYAIKVYSNELSCTSKLISNSQKSLRPSITYNGYNNLTSSFENMKSSQNEIVMQYKVGDKLKITGKSGIYRTTITEILDQSKEIRIPFIKCTDADGNNYSVVKIGDQYWTVENLKTTKYNDGTPIPNVTDGMKWWKLTTGAYCNYDNLESNAEIYGRLFNQNAVNTGKLAPKGWHVPTSDEWNILKYYLLDNGYRYEGLGVAKSMAAKFGWDTFSTAGTVGNDHASNNSSGFTALPGGCRPGGGGDFYLKGYWGCWRVSDENYELQIYGRCITYETDDLNFLIGQAENGMSVRLVKD